LETRIIVKNEDLLNDVAAFNARSGTWTEAKVDTNGLPPTICE